MKKITQKTIKYITFLVVVSILIPLNGKAAYGLDVGISAQEVGIPNRATVDGGDLSMILDTVYMIAAVVAVIVVVVAGIMYSKSSGDVQKIANAKRMIIYTVIGLIIVVSAFIITGAVLKGAQ